MKKKYLFVTLGLASVLALSGCSLMMTRKTVEVGADTDKTIYIEPGSDWGQANAVFDVWSWGGASADAWSHFSVVPTDSTHQKTTIKSDRTGLKILRRSPSDDRESWTNPWNDSGNQTIPSGMNCFKVNGWNNYSWVAYTEPAEPEPVHTYKYSLNGATAVEMTQIGTTTEYQSASVAFKAGDELTFTKDNVAYAVTAKDDDKLTTVEVQNDKLVFVEDYTGQIYLETATAKLWAGAFTRGYYLTGSFANWNPKHSMRATEKQDELGTYTTRIVTTEANVEVKFIDVLDNVAKENEISWKNIDATKLTIADGTPAELVDDTDPNTNLKLKTAGTYDLYYNSTNGWYSVVNPNYVPVYTVKVGTATPVAVELNEGTEYKTAEMTLTAGETVAVYKDGVATSDFTFKAIGNNNVDSQGKVLVSTNDRVYVDVSAKTIFVGGLAFGGYHMLVNGSFVEMTKNLHPMDESYREYSSGMMDFKKDDVVRFIDTTGDGVAEHANIFDITTINTSSLEGCFAAVDGHLVAQKDCEVSVYLKLKSGADEVYFGEVEEKVQKAAEFATAFNTSIGGVCKWDHYSTDEDALKDAWQAQVDKFGLLNVNVQQELKDADTTHNVHAIAEFIAKYELVASRYGTKLGNNYNFLGKTIVPAANPYINNAPIAANNAVMIAIVSVIALVSVASIVTVIVIKKKSLH